MAKDFLKQLTLIEELLKEEKSPLLPKLAEGIDIKQFQLSSFDGVIPEEVFKLFNWKNGVRDSASHDFVGSLSLFLFGIPLSFEEVARLQNQMTKHSFGWEKTMLPLFHSGGGDYHLIECDLASVSYGQIFYHSVSTVDFDKMITIYDSLYHLFDTTYQCYKNGIYHYSADTGQLEIDYDSNFDLSKELNPLSEYWKIYS